MKVLAIGAHFDDVELGCGGPLKHQENGDEIHILVVTHSGYENKSCSFIRSREEARTEGGKKRREFRRYLALYEPGTAGFGPI